MSRYFFSIVILNFNGLNLIRECLAHIEKQNFSDYEVIIVDNGSSDGSVDYLVDYVDGKENFKLILLNKNIGYSGGNNVAFKYVEGDYILLLNNDAFLKFDFLEKFYNFVKNNSEYHMFAVKVLRYDNPHLIDKAGHLIYFDGQNRGRGHMHRDGEEFNKMEEVLWPDGSAAVFKREVIEATNGFDPIFFAYGDDADLGMRARLLGYKAIYFPFCIAYHKHSSTAGRFSPAKVMLVERNRLFLLFKNFPLRYILFSPYYTALRYLYNFLGLIGKKGSAGKFKEENGTFKLIITLVRAYVSFFRHLPYILKNRWKIQRDKKLSTKEVISLLKKYEIDVKELTLIG